MCLSYSNVLEQEYFNEDIENRARGKIHIIIWETSSVDGKNEQKVIKGKC